MPLDEKHSKKRKLSDKASKAKEALLRYGQPKKERKPARSSY
jgi:hypothetical protein